MSKGPGRNDPCPCGSGKKYKRCHLPIDEARAHQEAEASQALFADLEPDDLDPHDSFIDIDDVIDVDRSQPFDVSALISVAYSRGFVKKLSDLERGRGLVTTEWMAPGIPAEIIDSLTVESLADLEGSWGDPDAGEPIQVDVIDLESENGIVTIEIFNRAIHLARYDSDEMKRLHRVCGVLHGLGGGTAPTPTDGPAAGIAGEDREAVARARDDALKQIRRHHGTCALCGGEFARSRMSAHLAVCAPAHDVAGGPAQHLVSLRIVPPGDSTYWLDVEVRSDAKLETLDAFLRSTWLECCDHLSMFAVGRTEYLSSQCELDDGFDFPGFRPRVVRRRMSVPIGRAFSDRAAKIIYEYDFGSTTRLAITIQGERLGRIGGPALQLLARNVSITWPCAVCGVPATQLCVYCPDPDGSAFVCDAHMATHDCGEEQAFLSVVNSPRMGVCAYQG